MTAQAAVTTSVGIVKDIVQVFALVGVGVRTLFILANAFFVFFMAGSDRVH